MVKTHMHVQSNNTWEQVISGALSVSGALIANIPGWLYGFLITRQLKIFYLGTVWAGLPPWQICGQMTLTDADGWVSTPANLKQCQIEIDRRFNRWEGGMFTFIYFSTMMFVAIKLMNCVWTRVFGSQQSAPVCGCNNDKWTKMEMCEFIDLKNDRRRTSD
jgi:hypothetical protein